MKSFIVKSVPFSTRTLFKKDASRDMSTLNHISQPILSNLIFLDKNPSRNQSLDVLCLFPHLSSIVSSPYRKRDTRRSQIQEQEAGGLLLVDLAHLQTTIPGWVAEHTAETHQLRGTQLSSWPPTCKFSRAFWVWLQGHYWLSLAWRQQGKPKLVQLDGIMSKQVRVQEGYKILVVRQ